MADVEAHIGADKLKQLLAARKVASSRMAEERGSLGSKLKGAQESDGLNMWAFNQVARLLNQDGLKAQADMRALMLYCDHVGIWAQGDLVELAKSMPDTRTAVEAAIDGDKDVAKAKQKEADSREAERRSTIDGLLKGGIKQLEPEKAAKNAKSAPKEKTGEVVPLRKGDLPAEPSAEMKRTALTQLKNALAVAGTAEAVATGFARWCDDNPDLAALGESVSQDRLAEIEAGIKPPIPQKEPRKPRQQPKGAGGQPVTH
jgi:hypothetical protein